MYYGERFNVNDCFALVKSKVSQNGIESEDCGIESLNIDGKTIISLCGNNTKQFSKARLYANYCLNWSWEYDDIDNVTSYAVYYPKSQPLFNTLMVNKSFDYEGLARVIFDQMIVKNNEVQSVEEITKNLSDVLFFGHSVGGFVMNELMYRLGLMLNDYKFSDKDIRKIYQSIVFVGYSPFELVDYPINSVYVAPIYDTMGSTQLIFNKILNRKNIISSNCDFDAEKLNKYKNRTYSEFFGGYQNIIDNQDSLYFLGKNALVSTPNLLYDDGIKEDHNLAGVIDYPAKNPYKTEAGENTTAFMHQVFNYGLSTERSKFKLSDLYQKVSDGFKRSNDVASVNKEF